MFGTACDRPRKVVHHESQCLDGSIHPFTFSSEKRRVGLVDFADMGSRTSS